MQTPIQVFFDALPRLIARDDQGVAINALTRAMKRARNAETIKPIILALDRQWRGAKPEEQAIVAPLYARALYDELSSRVPLELTHALAQAAKDPVAHCIHVKNLILSDKRAWALSYAQGVLSQYAVDADAAFAPLLDELAKLLGCSGWVGATSDQTIQGRLGIEVSNTPRAGFQFSVDGLTVAPKRFGKRDFSIALQAGNQRAPAFAVNGKPLLSYSISPRRIPAIDARVSLDGSTLSGWVTCARAPGLKPCINVRVAGQILKTLKNPHRISYSRWAFSAEIDLAAVHGQQLEVSASIEGLGTFVFPDSPVPVNVLAMRRPSPYQHLAAGNAAQRAATAAGTVIVPVYNNITDAVRCIRHVLAALPRGWQLIIVDDASTDPAAEAALATFAGGAARLVRNETNRGYAAAINAGIDLCSTDVVLLNSDALIFPGLLEHLHAVANAAADTGTVTAASTDDSIAGIDLPRQDEAAAIQIAQRIHQALQASSAPQPIAVPTGVGHCMYIKRACLQSTGPLDATMFPAGYGEETDFCFKASMRGWTHQIATGAFCFHAGGKSFSQRRIALLERGDAIMKKKYAWYEKTVRATLSNPALRQFKRRIQEQLLRMGNEEFALLITPRLWGGIDRAVAEHCDRLRKEGMTPLVIHPGHDLTQGELMLWHAGLKTNGCVYKCPDELAALLELLGWLRIRAVHIHHTVGIPFELIEQLTNNPALETHIYVHDYSWACTRINLLGRTGSYCGVPSIQECNRCTKAQGSLLNEKIGVAALRQRSAALFQKADTVNAVSQDITDRLSTMLALPAANFRPYALETAELAQPVAAVHRKKGRIKIALMGGIGFHKGYAVLLGCLRDAKKRKLPLDFLIIGVSHDNKKLMRYENLSITGHYKENEAEYLLARETPDIYFCASIVPESWCYTLTYAIRAGMPILSFNIGAQAARLKNYQPSHLLPINTSAAEINDLFLSHQSW